MNAQQPEGTFFSNDQVKAVNVLIAAAGVAQKAGAFSLEDAKVVFEAVKQFAPKKPQEPQAEESQE